MAWVQTVAEEVETGSNSSQLPTSQVVLQLPGLDLNQDKENQNLLCYRYTTG